MNPFYLGHTLVHAGVSRPAGCVKGQRQYETRQRDPFGQLCHIEPWRKLSCAFKPYLAYLTWHISRDGAATSSLTCRPTLAQPCRRVVLAWNATSHRRVSWKIFASSVSTASLNGRLGSVVARPKPTCCATFASFSTTAKTASTSRSLRVLGAVFTFFSPARSGSISRTYTMGRTFRVQWVFIMLFLALRQHLFGQVQVSPLIALHILTRRTTHLPS